MGFQSTYGKDWAYTVIYGRTESGRVDQARNTDVVGWDLGCCRT